MNDTGTTPTPARELSFGEKACGVTFNPSGDLQVAKTKSGFAALVDELNDLRNAPISEGMTNSNERNRMLSIAITELQSAQMWAVKAITWKY